MKLRKTLTLGISLLLFTGIALTGCSTSEKTNTNNANQKSSTSKKFPKVNIMVGGMEKIIYLPAKLTENLGYFKEEGLDVELTSQASGVNAEQSLIAGEVQGVVGFYDHSIDIKLKGKILKK